MKNENKHLGWYSLLILFVLTTGVSYLYIIAGKVVLALVGLPGLFTYWLWYKTFYEARVDYLAILPAYLITVAGFAFHVLEEFLGGYSLAISRIFNFAWTTQLFTLTILVISSALILVSVGLFYKKPLAGFIATLFIMTRFAELALFVFPLLSPAIEPDVLGFASTFINGVWVENMPTYYFKVTGSYYFPGMYSVLLPLIPAVIFAKKLLHSRPSSN